VWSPLAGGFLSGKYTRENPKGGSGDRLSGFDILPYDRERGYRIVALLQAIAARRGSSPARVALAWLLTRPAVSTLLIGASRVDQLDDNIGAMTLSLTPEDLSELDAASQPIAPYPQWFTERVKDSKVHEALGIALTTPPVR
jgi:aryl-alcohol dehydrogenase-like predicted oxidoreductase